MSLIFLDISQVLNSPRFPCPICSRYIGKEDYTPLVEPKHDTNGGTNGSVKKESIRQILVPIMFRHNLAEATNAARKFKLFGHPVVSSIPSSVEKSTVIEVVAQTLKNVSAASLSYDIVVTDGTGLSCGLCDLFSSCTGCCVKDDNAEMLKLKPGCCLSVHFHDNINMVVKTLSLCHDDDSMQTFRNTDKVSLEECLAKFGDAEVLTKENPWFCPNCQTNQIAVKNMTVTRWPETVVIQLKRFYFEGNQCCKIECPVVFPMTSLNLDMLSCVDATETSRHSATSRHGTATRHGTEYNLYSFICHSGTLFGGHYTAHAKMSVDAEWNYFNDETYENMNPPTDEENQKAYVLFYQRSRNM